MTSGNVEEEIPEMIKMKESSANQQQSYSGNRKCLKGENTCVQKLLHVHINVWSINMDFDLARCRLTAAKIWFYGVEEKPKERE